MLRPHRVVRAAVCAGGQLVDARYLIALHEKGGTLPCWQAMPVSARINRQGMLPRAHTPRALPTAGGTARLPSTRLQLVVRTGGEGGGAALCVWAATPWRRCCRHLAALRVDGSHSGLTPWAGAPTAANPPCAVCGGAGMWRLYGWTARGSLGIVVLSYPWLDYDHPDSAGETLARLAPILKVTTTTTTSSSSTTTTSSSGLLQPATQLSGGLARAGDLSGWSAALLHPCATGRACSSAHATPLEPRACNS